MQRKDIYLFAGLALLVGSFFAASRALGSLISIVYLVYRLGIDADSASETSGMVQSLNAAQLNVAIHGLVSFLILFFGGRWMLSAPPILERWANRRRVDEEDRV